MNIFPLEVNGNKKAGSLFSLMIFSFIVFNLIVSLVLRVVGLGAELLSALSTLSILFASITASVLTNKDKKSLLSLVNEKISPVYIAVAVLIAFSMIFGLGFINALIEKFFSSIGITAPATDLNVSNAGEFILYSIFLALVPAVAEELFFRGVLITNLKTDNLTKILISALCFSVYHCSINKLAYQFIYGAILALIFIKTNNLILPIITHFLNNFIILTVDFIGITVDLFNPICIAVGVAVLAVCLMLLLKNLKLKNQLEQVEKAKDFFIPYSLIGFIICLVMIVGGVL